MLDEGFILAAHVIHLITVPHMCANVTFVFSLDGFKKVWLMPPYHDNNRKWFNVDITTWDKVKNALSANFALNGEIFEIMDVF